jgi:hypothetical protein
MLLDSPYTRGMAIDGGASAADVEAFHALQTRADGFVVYLSPPG